MLRDLIEHFSKLRHSNKNVPSDLLGQAYEYLIKKFADATNRKAGEFYTPRSVVCSARAPNTAREARALPKLNTYRRPADKPGGNSEHRLVLSHEPLKPAAGRRGRRPRRPVLRSPTEGGSRSRSQSHGSGLI